MRTMRLSLAIFCLAGGPLVAQERLAIKGGKPEKEAIQLAETVDRDRAAFIKQYFGADWFDRHRFHLMVNSTIGEAAAVETILNSIALFERQRLPSAPSAQQPVAS